MNKKFLFRKSLLASCAAATLCAAAPNTMAGSGNWTPPPQQSQVPSLYEPTNSAILSDVKYRYDSASSQFIGDFIDNIPIKYNGLGITVTSDIDTAIKFIDVNGTTNANLILTVGASPLIAQSQNVLSSITNPLSLNIPNIANPYFYDGPSLGALVIQLPGGSTSANPAYSPYMTLSNEIESSFYNHNPTVNLFNAITSLETALSGIINTTLQLGSVVNNGSSGNNNKLNVTVNDGQTLFLTGDNYESSPTTLQTDSTGNLTNLRPNATYSYITVVSQEYYINGNNITIGTNNASIPSYAQIKITGNGLTTPVSATFVPYSPSLMMSNSLPAGSYLVEFNGDPVYTIASNDGIATTTLSGGGSYPINGPYNDYNSHGTISVGTNSKIVVKSKLDITSKMSSNNSSAPSDTSTTLSNLFSFTGTSSGTFDSETNTTVTDPSFAGFANITGSSYATLTINIANNTPITLNNAWTNTGGGTQNTIVNNQTISTPVNSYLGTLNVQTPVTITSHSVKNLGRIKVTAAVPLTIRAQGTDFVMDNGRGIKLEHEDATLILESSGSGSQNFTFTEGFTDGNDLYGKVKISALNVPVSIISNSTDIGYTSLKRLKSFEIEGDRLTDVNTGVYTKELDFNTSGAVYLKQVGMGNNGIINVMKTNASNSLINILTDSGVTVNLGSNTLHASGQVEDNGNITHQNSFSSLDLRGAVEINSTYDGTNAGQIIVDGSASAVTTYPSALSFAAQNTTLTINFNTDGKIPSSSSAIPILSATNGAEITLPNTPVSFNPLNSNILATWIGSYDQTTQVYSVSAKIQAVEALPVNTPTSTVAVVNFLATPAIATTTPDGIVEQTFSQPQIEALSAIGSISTTEELVRNANALVVQAVNAADAGAEAMAESIRAITSQATGSGFNADDILTHEEDLGTTAGDSTSNRGVWMSGYLQKSTQKKIDGTAGYKAKGFGGTLGADTKVTDEIILGAAWTHANSLVKQGEGALKNKSNVDTNIFSIYGLKLLPSDWAIEANASIGFSKSKNTSVRYEGNNPTNSIGKYKSHYYGSSLEAIKRIKPTSGDFFIEPTIGLSYTKFDDMPYKESLGKTNWNLAKRSSYNLESLLGIKLISLYNFEDWAFKPQAGAYAHITLKDKKGKVHMSLDGTPGAVIIDQSKASKAWYSGGLAMSINKGAIEVGAGWEIQLDKKYVSNKGTIKLRIEF